jgi:biopolymer transport protein ExbB
MSERPWAKASPLSWPDTVRYAERLKKSSSPAATVALAGLDEADSGVHSAEEAMAGAVARVRLNLERYLAFLGTVGNNAPFVGLFGTVIGITEAIACLSPTQLDNISGVVAGLGTAFDTTATALALSMVLMFLQFVIDRHEQSLLAKVDDAACSTMSGRFQTFGDGDGTALAVARLGETLGRGTARLLEAQV